MGNSAPRTRASEIVQDGALALIPGNTNGALKGDEQIREHSSGLLDCVNAVTLQAARYFPFAATIIAVRYKVRTQLGTAGAVCGIGIPGNTSKFANRTVPTSEVAGTEGVFTITDATVDAGEVVGFTTDGGATGTGDIDVTILYAPRVP